jgi:hypothetical protein
VAALAALPTHAGGLFDAAPLSAGATPLGVGAGHFAAAAADLFAADAADPFAAYAVAPEPAPAAVPDAFAAYATGRAHRAADTARTAAEWHRQDGNGLRSATAADALFPAGAPDDPFAAAAPPPLPEPDPQPAAAAPQGPAVPQTPWHELLDPTHQVPYYFNEATGESVWEPPAEYLAAVAAATVATVAATSDGPAAAEAAVAAAYHRITATAATAAARAAEPTAEAAARAAGDGFGGSEAGDFFGGGGGSLPPAADPSGWPSSEPAPPLPAYPAAGHSSAATSQVDAWGHPIAPAAPGGVWIPSKGPHASGGGRGGGGGPRVFNPAESSSSGGGSSGAGWVGGGGAGSIGSGAVDCATLEAFPGPLTAATDPEAVRAFASTHSCGSVVGGTGRGLLLLL